MLSMHLALHLLGGAAAAGRWGPSAECQAAADHACNANPSVLGPAVDLQGINPIVALEKQLLNMIGNQV
jgi:hypothetical protein